VIPQFAKQQRQQNSASNGWQFSLLRFGLTASKLPAGDIGFNPRFRD
jgi:hypothetical protein